MQSFFSAKLLIFQLFKMSRVSIQVMLWKMIQILIKVLFQLLSGHTYVDFIIIIIFVDKAQSLLSTISCIIKLLKSYLYLAAIFRFKLYEERIKCTLILILTIRVIMKEQLYSRTFILEAVMIMNFVLFTSIAHLYLEIVTLAYKLYYF